MRGSLRALGVLAALVGALGSCGGDAARGIELTFSGSAVGGEGELLRRQLDAFMREHPEIRVRILPTPDDATQRHQLFVQWLNARVGDPDVLQLDVVWTAEFAAAGWITALDRWSPDTADFFPATMRANRWDGALYALPWFVDAGMLYWRTDLVRQAPASLAELRASALAALDGRDAPPFGLVWQGARYEGLVTVFLEYLGAFGGRILDDGARAVVDSEAAVRALTFMREQIGTIAPPDVLTWHEEETRFAFQNGRAVFMRNWPYAYTLLSDTSASRVAGRFSVATMPAADGGEPTATLGGAQLAINTHTEYPDSAWLLVEHLTAPAQMLDRARLTGQFPARMRLYDDPALEAALAVPAARAREIVTNAEPRPVTPIWSELSEVLQIHLHRALTGQVEPREALARAAREMNALLQRSGLADRAAGVRGS